MQPALPLHHSKCVEAAVQGAQAVSVSVLLPQAANLSWKQAATSLRLAAEPREEEKPSLDAMQQFPG